MTYTRLKTVTKYQSDPTERDRINRNNKKYRDTHPEKMAAQKRADKVRIREYRRNKYNTDPVFRELCKVRNRIYLSKKKGVTD